MIVDVALDMIKERDGGDAAGRRIIMVEIAKLARTLDNAAHKARATRQLSAPSILWTMPMTFRPRRSSGVWIRAKRNGTPMGFTGAQDGADGPKRHDLGPPDRSDDGRRRGYHLDQATSTRASNRKSRFC